MKDYQHQISQVIPAIRAHLTRNGIPPIICYDKASKFDPDIEIKRIDDTEKMVAEVIDEIANFNLLSGLLKINTLGYFGVGKSYEEARAELYGSAENTISLNASGKFSNKAVIVTGGAQGFGKGIVKKIASEGAFVIIADLNYEKAAATAFQINHEMGCNQVLSCKTDVTNADSVQEMVRYSLHNLGGIDILISNAGVLKAGSLEEVDEKAFEFVNAVNYKGFFLCAKYCAEVMKNQHKYDENAFYDIIQINSKSGLEGSNKNFAYAGSKFGAIGLTQSFALELVAFHIKVNAICPGNYFEGPLWADPENGLFAQYLKAGKVPGAKTIEDVQRFYEEKVPLKRGCTPSDVVKAIFYLTDQHYETGQALPVTGGQIMLN